MPLAAVWRRWLAEGPPKRMGGAGLRRAAEEGGEAYACSYMQRATQEGYGVVYIHFQSTWDGKQQCL